MSVESVKICIWVAFFFFHDLDGGGGGVGDRGDDKVRLRRFAVGG